MRSVAVAAAAAVIVSALLGVVAVPARAATFDSFESDLVAQVNGFRASKGLPTLTVSDALTASATWMVIDMAERDYFSHTSLDGREPTRRMADAGYPAYGTWTGEDLAAGYTSAAAVLQGWIDSPEHYAVLTNPAYRAIGVGCGYSATSAYGWYWAADFGGIAGPGTTVARSASGPPAGRQRGIWTSRSSRSTPGTSRGSLYSHRGARARGTLPRG